MFTRGIIRILHVSLIISRQQCFYLTSIWTTSHLTCESKCLTCTSFGKLYKVQSMDLMYGNMFNFQLNGLSSDSFHTQHHTNHLIELISIVTFWYLHRDRQYATQHDEEGILWIRFHLHQIVMTAVDTGRNGQQTRSKKTKSFRGYLTEYAPSSHECVSVSCVTSVLSQNESVRIVSEMKWNAKNQNKNEETDERRRRISGKNQTNSDIKMQTTRDEWYRRPIRCRCVHCTICICIYCVNFGHREWGGDGGWGGWARAK